MSDFIGTSSNDSITGRNGDDMIEGGAGDDKLSGGAGDDVLSGGAGDDSLVGGAGEDVLDGGAGDDDLNGAAGDDLFVYVAAENGGATDSYKGGSGVDTIRLVLTRDEWMDPALQADIAAYLSFMATNTHAKTGQAPDRPFQFTAFDLSVTMMERLEIVVDGVAIDPTDQGVTLGADTIAADEDNLSVATVDVLANDSVPDLIRDIAFTQPAHGTATLDASLTDPSRPSTAVFTYTPDSAHWQSLAVGETGTDSFTYTVTDADGDTQTVTVSVVITGSNDGPVVTTAPGQELGTVVEAGNEDGGAQAPGTPAATGTLSASDVDNNAVLSWSGDADGTYGRFAIDPATGAWVYTLENGRDATQALAEGQSETETFLATVTDEHGATATQLVTVTVTGINDSPVAVADTAAASENETVTIDVLANDTDVDAGSSFTLISADAPAGQGFVSIAANQLVFAPGSDFDDLSAGQTEIVTVSYTMSDAFGAVSTSTVTITVTGTNDGPVVGAGDTSGAVIEAEPVTGIPASATPVLAETAGPNDVFATAQAIDRADMRIASNPNLGDDSDPAISITGSIEGPTDEDVYRIELQPGETITLDIDFALGFGSTAYDGYNGAPGLDAFVFIYDAAGNLLNSNDDAPTGLGGAGSVHVQDSYLQFTAPQAGSYYIVVHDWNGDGAMSQGPYTLQVSLDSQNLQLTDTGSVAFIDLDLADGHSVSVTPGEGGYLGALTAAVADPATGDGAGSVRWDFSVSNAAVQYLAEGETLTQSYTLAVSDGQGGVAEEIVTVTVTGTNDQPVITTAFSTGDVIEDVTATAGGQIHFGDVDLRDGHSVSSEADLPGYFGTFTAGLADASTGDGSGRVDWSFEVDPADIQHLGAGQWVVQRYTVTIDDGEGGTTQQLVNVTITGTNDGPVISGPVDGIATEDGAAITLDALAHATDADDDAVLNVTGLPATLPAGVSFDAATSRFTLDPSHPAFQVLSEGEVTVVTVDYGVSDGSAVAPASVSWTVTGTNDAPTAAAVDGTVSEDGPALSIALAGADADSENDASNLTYTIVSGPSAGTATISGSTLTFDPGSSFDHLAAGETEEITLYYQATDARGASSTGAPVAGPVTTLAHFDLADVTSARSLAAETVAAGIGVSPLTAVGGLIGTPFSNHFYLNNWGTTLDTSKYYETTLDAGDSLVDLATVSFSVENAGASASTWVLRSSADGFTSDLATGTVTTQNVTNFTADLSGLADVSDAITFRWYFITPNGGTTGLANHEPGGSGGGLSDAGQDVRFTGSFVTADLGAPVTITVTGVNDAPVIVQLAGDAATYTEGQSWAYLDTGRNAALSDIDNMNFAGGSLTIRIADGGVAGEDALYFIDIPGSGLTYSGNRLFVDGVEIGTFSPVGMERVFTFNANATPEHVQTLVRNMGYVGSGGNDPTEGTRTIEFVLTDGSGGTVSATTTLDVVGVNDAPAVSGPVAGTAAEDSASATLSALATASDPEGSALQVTGLPATLPAGVSYDAATASFTLDPAHAAYQSLGAGETTVVTVDYAVTDGTASTPGSASWTVTGTNDAPTIVAPGSVFAGPPATTFGGGHVDVTSTAAFTGTGAFSYEVTFKTSATGIYQNVFSVGYFDTNKAAGITIAPDGTLHGNVINRHDSTVSSGVVTDGQWHTATFTHDGAGNFTLYLDGVEIDTAYAPGVNLTHGVALIGAANTDVRNAFQGEIADAHIWTRELSAAEAADLSTPAADDAGLIGSYLFSSGSAENVASGGMADGTIVGNVILGSGISAQVRELPAGIAGAETAILSETGSILFTDADLSDTHAASAAPQGAGYVGTLTLSVDQASNAVDWQFSVADSALASLGAGETLTQVYAVTVSDGKGGSAVQNVTVTLTGSNDAPVAAADAAATDEDTAILIPNLAGNDTDADGDALIVTGVPAVSAMGAALTLNPDGSVAYDPTGASALEGLTRGEQAVDSFTYTVSDGQGGLATQTAHVTVSGKLEAPIANADSAATGENVPTSGNVVANDQVTGDTAPSGNILVNPSFEDGNPIGPNSYTVVASVPGWTATDGVEVWGTGFLGNVAGDGGVFLELDQGGAQDTYSQTLSTEAGREYRLSFDLAVRSGTDPATNRVEFLVNGVSLGVFTPDSTSFETYTVSFVGSGSDTIAFREPASSNDGVGGLIDNLRIEADADVFVTAVNGGVSGVGAPVSGTSGGSFTVAANGDYGFDPGTDFDYLAAGETATTSVTYTVTDDGGSATASLTVTVTGTNDAPVVTAAAGGAITEAAPNGGVDGFESGTAGWTMAGGGAVPNEGPNGGFSGMLGRFAGTGGAQAVSKTFSLDPAQATTLIAFDFLKVDSWDAYNGDGLPGNEEIVVFVNGVAAFRFMPEGFDNPPGSDGATGSFTLPGGITGTYSVTSSGSDTAIGFAGGFGDRVYAVELVLNGAGANVTLGFGSTLDQGIGDEAFGIDNVLVTHRLSDSGTATFSDADLTDTHSAAFAAQGAGYIGTFTLGPIDQAADSVGWHFEVDDRQIDALGAGDTRVQSYAITISDGKGGSATEIVEVVMTGVNDVALIGGVSTGAVSEDGVLTASGQLLVSDVDSGEALLQPVAAGTAGDNGYGAFSVVADGQWSYALDNDNPVVQALGLGETLTDTITVTSADGTASETITVTIAGAFDSGPNLIVDFEDLAGSFVADGYAGFDWDSPSGEDANASYGYVVGRGTSIGSGVSQTPGDQYVWSNGGTAPLTLSRMDGSDFDFESGYFLAVQQNTTLVFEGYDDGVLVETHTVFLQANVSTFVDVDWGNIDTLVLNYPEGSVNLSMDNLAFVIG